MSYYYTVGLKMEPKAKEYIFENLDMSRAEKYIDPSDGNTVVFWECNAPKFREIEAVLDELDSLDDLEGNCYSYVYIGEEAGDVQRRCNDWDLDFFPLTRFSIQKEDLYPEREAEKSQE